MKSECPSPWDGPVVCVTCENVWFEISSSFASSLLPRSLCYNPFRRHINLSHCYHIFPWLCVWGGCTIIMLSVSHTHTYIYIYIYIYPGKAVFCIFNYRCSLMMCANNQVHHGLMVVYSYLHTTPPHYHHYADLSEGIELLKCLSDIFCLECASKIRSVL